MAKSMGYLLPSGDAFEEDLACMILFYPDRAEYRQALFGSLDYLATWTAWERDDEKRGIDAGRAWALAVLATRECLEMNTCETILSLLTEIRDNTGVYCCGVVDISDGDQYTDAVQDGVGNVPQNIIDAGYADDAADWDGFADYKCMVSHLMVDNMEAQAAKVLSFMLPSGAILGGVGALAAIAAVFLTGGGAVLIYGIVVAIAIISNLYAAAALLGEAGMSDLVDDLATHHDELACAIYDADGSSGAVDALKDKIDELFSVVEAAFLKNLNLPAQLKSLYAGRYDQQDVAEIMANEGYDTADYSCACPTAEYSYLATFDTDIEYWNDDDAQGWAADGNPSGSVYVLYNELWMKINNAGLRASQGLGGGSAVTIKHVSLQFKRTVSTQPSTCRVIFAPLGINEAVDRTGLSVGPWHQLDFAPVGEAVVDWNDYAVYLDNLVGTTGGSLYDNVRVWFDAA